ncbi:MAG: zinc-binding dehydrogenase [Nitrospiraceae bacterium]|nr:zinc-binding dehydrogenase [Nitrospiraceae bacterium]
MLTAVLEKPGTIEVRDIVLPEPAEGELLVQVKAALTCGTDLKAFVRGHSLIPMPGPFGHEFSGIIVDKGKGVSKFRIGDPVMGVHSAPCLDCGYCRKGLFNLCEKIMSTKALGAFAEYILLPRHVVAQNVFRKPEKLNFREAAFLEPLACVVHGMEGLGIKKGDTVFIIGAGPIGLLHLLLARSKGARVMITGLEMERLKTAKKLGAERICDPGHAADAAREFGGGLGVDYVFECTGQPAIWEVSVNYVRRGGTVVLFGGCKADTTVTFNAERLHYDEIGLKGTFHFTPGDVKKAHLLLKNGVINVRPLISGAFRLGDIQQAFQKLVAGEGIKYAIVP